MARCCLVFFIAFCFSLGAMGQGVAPKYSNEFLHLGVGARAFGMGMSAVASTNDVTAGYWNPAGLMKTTANGQIMLMHAAYFAGLANYDYAGFVTSLDTTSKIAISIVRFSVDNIPNTHYLIDANGAINYDLISFFSAADYAMLLSYARDVSLLGGLSLGGSTKIVHRRVGDFATAWGFGLDFGVHKSFGDWQFAVMGRDIFGTFSAWNYNLTEFSDIYQATGNELPQNSLEITLPRLILATQRHFDLSEHFDLTITTDVDVTFDGRRNTLVRSELISLDPHAGLEFGFRKLAFLRMGISQFQTVQRIHGGSRWTFLPTTGVGIKFAEVTIDYAMADIGDQAVGLYSHIFSVRADFNARNK